MVVSILLLRSVSSILLVFNGPFILVTREFNLPGKLKEGDKESVLCLTKNRQMISVLVSECCIAVEWLLVLIIISLICKAYCTVADYYSRIQNPACQQTMTDETDNYLTILGSHFCYVVTFTLSQVNATGQHTLHPLYAF